MDRVLLYAVGFFLGVAAGVALLFIALYVGRGRSRHG